MPNREANGHLRGVMDRYGIPYKGSKNAIAEDVVNALPPGGKILDACCGGGLYYRL